MLATCHNKKDPATCQFNAIYASNGSEDLEPIFIIKKKIIINNKQKEDNIIKKEILKARK